MSLEEVIKQNTEALHKLIEVLHANSAAFSKPAAQAEIALPTLIAPSMIVETAKTVSETAPTSYAEVMKAINAYVQATSLAEGKQYLGSEFGIDNCKNLPEERWAEFVARTKAKIAEVETANV